ncbi:MAG TPA: hypothetical protein VEL12_14930 [Candidatus Nitrosopolaris sp.]|nr:hypothetical protein [Candidatus Nitrosopolaris sp.]
MALATSIKRMVTEMASASTREIVAPGSGNRLQPGHTALRPGSGCCHDGVVGGHLGRRSVKRPV